jgi:hypothetical protein
MTFIQPNKHKNILTILIVLQVLALFGGTFWIVVVYNKTVSMSHDITAFKSELDAMGAKSTAVSNSIIATLGGTSGALIAQNDNLIQEKKPQYFPIAASWPIASQ